MHDTPITYYYNELPLYSYPNSWSAPETASRATYLEIEVYWNVTVDDGSSSENIPYYYQVPITDTKELKRNNAYKVYVDISMLGSSDPTKPFTLQGELEVIGWEEITFDAELNRYKYLSVSPQQDTLYNVAQGKYKYTSSSPITIKDIKVTYINYENENNPSAEVPSPQNNGFKAFIVGNEIQFEHKIDKETQFYPYTITITVSNEDNNTETINIVQYPAIYVEAEKNSSGSSNRFIFGENTRREDFKVKLSNGTDINLGSILDINQDATEDDNNNQYNIHVSAFDENDKWDAHHYKGGEDMRPYRIGDPRNSEPETVTLNGLQTYYATRTDVESQSIVAPIFKVASSWGGFKTATSSTEAYKHRCSSYQENGYPAGRWRLPTEAEIQYINKLSKAGKIPTLFDPDNAYFAASGRGWKWASKDKGWGSMGEFGYGFARCVYDVWYWGDEPAIKNKNTFVWGDNPDGSLRKFNGDPYVENN